MRPILCIESARIFSADMAPVLPVACAMEFIHTYSLIHDDLPALDNDDLRRGQPTCHKKFGEAMAILAGDALLTLAFETLADAPVEHARRVAIVGESPRRLERGTAWWADKSPISRPRASGHGRDAFLHSSLEDRRVDSRVGGFRRDRRRRGGRPGADSTFWRPDRLGVSGDRRHSRRGGIVRGAGQDRGKRSGAAQGHVSGAFWSGEIAPFARELATDAIAELEPLAGAGIICGSSATFWFCGGPERRCPLTGSSRIRTAVMTSPKSQKKDWTRSWWNAA